jgi:4-amino-4-deoxy-L-arabinose transferase-like glycosyltransferase
VWVITVFLFFSFSTTKLATYILLIFPPLSIVTGYWILVLAKKKSNVIKNIIVFLLLLLVPVFAYAFNLLLKWNIEQLLKSMVLIKISLCAAFLFIGVLFSLFYVKKSYLLIISFALVFIVSFVFGLNSYLVPYYKYTHADLRDFAEYAGKAAASGIISFGMYRPSLVYYSGMPVDFSDKKGQKLKIKNYALSKSNVCIVGHTDDIEKNKELFKNIKILDKRIKYFIGVILYNAK